MNDDRTPQDNGILLSEMIEQLRAELQASMQLGNGKEIAFNIDKAELELKVAVSKKAKGSTGIAFWVVKAEAGVEGQRDFAHTFKLTLKPVSGKTGEPINIAALVPQNEAPGDH
jgi:hypothetical protein